MKSVSTPRYRVEAEPPQKEQSLDIAIRFMVVLIACLMLICSIFLLFMLLPSNTVVDAIAPETKQTVSIYSQSKKTITALNVPYSRPKFPIRK